MKNNYIVRMENLACLILVTYLYQYLRYSWLLFAILFLAPDLFMIGYFLNSKIASQIYNLAHTYAFPIIVAVIGLYLNFTTIISICLIWTAHIAMDRTFGFGLKYATGFKDTTLQKI